MIQDESQHLLHAQIRQRSSLQIACLQGLKHAGDFMEGRSTEVQAKVCYCAIPLYNSSNIQTAILHLPFKP